MPVIGGSGARHRGVKGPTDRPCQHHGVRHLPIVGQPRGAGPQHLFPFGLTWEEEAEEEVGGWRRNRRRIDEEEEEEQEEEGEGHN